MEMNLNTSPVDVKDPGTDSATPRGSCRVGGWPVSLGRPPSTDAARVA